MTGFPGVWASTALASGTQCEGGIGVACAGYGRLIAKVNATLPEDPHPVEVQAWHMQLHADLFIGGDVDACVSPLDWLRSGADLDGMAQLARWL